jgi:hypothetical protein
VVAEGEKKKAFFLFDEMQNIFSHPSTELAVRELCRFLEQNGIPYTGRVWDF